MFNKAQDADDTVHIDCRDVSMPSGYKIQISDVSGTTE